MERLDELARYAAEQVLDILSADSIQLVEDIRLVAVGPSARSETDEFVSLSWQVDYGDEHSFPVNMLLLSEHLEDEEALVLSMAAWILDSIRGSDAADHAL